ncbi:RICIN domain-containing protein [Candidatus Saccharibacteria bacterium]|nr:RICIN domain-containing protein [Candidatus Saccharibacteria bacterium]
MQRRRSRRTWLVMLGVFVAVFLFSFLVQKNKNGENVSAASLANFDPGFIISDYQMGNYNSMSESDIQKFLTAKNPCSNRDYNYYKTLSANKKYKWHFANGHFVCLSEERFGDGEVIGSGQTAAHIIWQAAQDYRINPQVILVLLQKETGLITDPIPNNGDYRKATGYGCPDTAACSSKYYGFKNQVRNAVKLFRAVLDGGWTNYPLGKNYVQYNPNKACGGSIVNIRSLATSALYRYTPYQPNAGALAAGYGTASCGAYGNRNFYLYFQDWFGGITKTQGSAKVANGRYYIQLAKNSSFNLDVTGAVDKNGTNIQLYNKNTTVAQQWDVSYNAVTDDYTIKSALSGRALDVSGAGTSNGVNVQMWEANNTCAQRWKIIRISNDTLKMISACSNKALDVSAGVFVNGSNIQIWADNGSDAQKWKLVPTNNVAEGLYHISSAMNSNKLIDLSGGSYGATNGTNVHLWKKNYTAAQQWYIAMTKDGYYTIKNLQNGRYLDVSSASVKNGTNIHVWGGNGTCAQKWRILRVSGKYEFISACSTSVLDLTGANTASGANIQLYNANNTNAQKWNLEKVEKIENSDYEIVSSLSDKMVVNISNKQKSNGTNVQIYENNETFAQKWQIKYNKNDGYYTFYNAGANKVLDVQGAVTVNSGNVQIWDNNSTCAQKWVIENVGGGYSISSACSGLMLDVDGAKSANGTNVQIYESNGTKAQKWTFKKVN